jgi:hypothetical protein
VTRINPRHLGWSGDHSEALRLDYTPVVKFIMAAAYVYTIRAERNLLKCKDKTG